jgi:acyl carrier protein
MSVPEEVRALLLRLISEECGTPAAEIDLSKTPADLGIDSLTRLQMLVDVEDELHIEIPDQGLSVEQSFAELEEVILRAAAGTR